MSTIHGTFGDDTLHGTGSGDVLRLFGGPDRAWGEAGDDRLDGGSGNDTLKGGADDDLLLGRQGNDRLNGETGDDTVFGGDGWDRLVGDQGSDRLFGGNDRDSLWGSAGRDRLDGGSGDDTLIGDGNPDRLIGGAGDDMVEGGHGNDRLWGDGVGTAAAAASIDDGDDVALYLGVRAGYRITTDSGITVIEDLDPSDGDDGTDWLQGVERARFGDGTEVNLGSTRGVFELSSLDGSNGFVINGAIGTTECGWLVSGAGDVNGDGVDDLIIVGGDQYPHSANTFTSYVVFGSSSGFTASLELSSLDGGNGFAITGAYNRYWGDVSGAGDINGDGFDDLIISSTYAAICYVVFGASSGFAASLKLADFDGSTDLDGSNGFQILGAEFSQSGYSVSGAGDVNGDGFDDLIIGAPKGGPRGQGESYTYSLGYGASYIVFGSAAGFDAKLELSSLDGSNGIVINGVHKHDNSGWSVSGTGDVNGDGVDDVIIGAPYAGPRDLYRFPLKYGASYVVFGSSAGFAASLELSSLDGSNGFVINGVNAEDVSGARVTGAGDVNGDGVNDLVIVAPVAAHSYVVFGSSAGFTASLDLSSLDGNSGFVINGSNWSVSGAGDVNGDGVDDVIIGVPGADPNGDYSGASYVVFGSASGFAASLDLSSLDGSNGFVINGIASGDASGNSVSGAVDVNGDGIDDLIIGAPGAGPIGAYSGASYVVFGSASGFAASLDVAALPMPPELGKAASEMALL